VAKPLSKSTPPYGQALVTKTSRSTELGLMTLAWIIVTAFYVLASYGAQGHMPPRIWLFLGSIVAISLGMHVAIRHTPPTPPRCSYHRDVAQRHCYVEIARWNPSEASYQAVWFLVSAVGVVLTLKFVRRVRDLDRYRYLTLSAAIVLMLCRSCPTWARRSTAHACGS